ncbi:TonB family protein [Magnetospirillum fulvum]|uniref:TonB family C-terminal domain-containing protein n=1 Tax=Magnetospirillum fulvum TaxID=1082 RepID=A0A1H6JF40_MAGFU|nr:TonB family protein [Magnetospirillum fulvum]SEH60497.1 TonB family C-terminal domain-containing protein [Magnetospirillum fulvum]
MVRSRFFAIAAACLVSASALAEPQVGERYAFDLPAQPLDTALAVFCEVTGSQVLYESAHTAGRRTAPLRGSFTREEALRQLLDGTGLAARGTVSEAFTLVPGEPPPSQPSDHRAPPALPLDLPRMWRPFAAFLGAAQADIVAALCEAALLSPGMGTLSVRFRIAPSGDIAPVRLLHSSGNRLWDDAVVAALNRVTLGPPPRDLPQPITLSIGGGSDGEAVCPSATLRRD